MRNSQHSLTSKLRLLYLQCATRNIPRNTSVPRPSQKTCVFRATCIYHQVEQTFRSGSRIGRSFGWLEQLEAGRGECVICQWVRDKILIRFKFSVLIDDDDRLASLKRVDGGHNTRLLLRLGRIPLEHCSRAHLQTKGPRSIGYIALFRRRGQNIAYTSTPTKCPHQSQRRPHDGESLRSFSCWRRLQC